MRKAGRTVLNFLRSETAEWVKDGIISGEQSESILSRYENAGNAKSVPAGFITALLVIGACLVGAGIILTIASNWQDIPAAAKVAMIFTLILAAYGAGFYFHFIKPEKKNFGLAMILLGCFFYGGAIFLVGQIFHIEGHWPDAFLYWFLGIIPLAWLLNSRFILGIAMIPLFAWAFSDMAAFSKINYLLPVLLGATVFPLAYRQRSKPILFLAITAAFIWVQSFIAFTFLRGNNNLNYSLTLQYLLNCLVLSVGLFHGFSKKVSVFMNVYKVFAYLNLFSLLYIYSFTAFAEWFTDAGMPEGPLGAVYWVLFALTLVSSMVYIFLHIKRNSRKTSPLPGEIWEGLYLLLATLFMPFLLTPHYVLPANLLFFFSSIGFIYIGYLRQSRAYANAGLSFFSVLLITRYIDIGFNFMDRAVFFIVLGLLLLGGAVLLTKLQRKLIHQNRERKNG